MMGPERADVFALAQEGELSRVGTIRTSGAQPGRSRAVARLGGVALFQHVDTAALGDIARLAQHKHVAAGALFFLNEGEEADLFYVVVAGRIELTQVTAEGHQVTLRFAGPGEAFGGVGAFGEPT